MSKLVAVFLILTCTTAIAAALADDQADIKRWQASIDGDFQKASPRNAQKAQLYAYLYDELKRVQEFESLNSLAKAHTALAKRDYIEAQLQFTKGLATLPLTLETFRKRAMYEDESRFETLPSVLLPILAKCAVEQGNLPRAETAARQVLTNDRKSRTAELTVADKISHIEFLQKVLRFQHKPQEIAALEQEKETLLDSK